MVYHRAKRPVIVTTQEEYAALGDGWADSPSAAATLAEGPAVSAPADVPVRRPRGRPRKDAVV